MLVSDKEAHSNVGIVAKAASYQRTILTIWLSVYFILTSSYVKMPREVLGLSAAAAGSTVPVLCTEGALGATTATVLGGTLLELLESGQVLGTTRFLGGAEPTTGADLLAGAETGSAGRVSSQNKPSWASFWFFKLRLRVLGFLSCFGYCLTTFLVSTVSHLSEFLGAKIHV